MTNASVATQAMAENTLAKPTRLMSLDALRGFDMFWIIGADELVHGLRKASDNHVLQELAHQLEHVGWAGFHFEDLIFPMFVFIVGVSLVFSLDRAIEQEGRRKAVARVLRRGLLLYLLGVFYYGGFSTPFQGIRLLGVLQRIALAYLFAGLIYCYLGLRGRLAACLVLLLGYWALMTFVPVPGLGAGHFEPTANLAYWVDKSFLPLRRWNGDWDPEGLLSTLPAMANCLMGVFAGNLLKSQQNAYLKVVYLVVGGAACAGLGWLWDARFPVIKNIWTSSFVLVAVGYSAIFLALFYLVIDVWRLRLWAQPFVWIGMNPITIYMIHNLVDIGAIANRFVGGDLKKLYLGQYGDLAVALVGMAITMGICRFLYQRKIFIRL
jgi:predicted acyltransferase